MRLSTTVRLAHSVAMPRVCGGSTRLLSMILLLVALARVCMRPMCSVLRSRDRIQRVLLLLLLHLLLLLLLLRLVRGLLLLLLLPVEMLPLQCILPIKHARAGV